MCSLFFDLMVETFKNRHCYRCIVNELLKCQRMEYLLIATMAEYLVLKNDIRSITDEANEPDPAATGETNTTREADIATSIQLYAIHAISTIQTQPPPCSISFSHNFSTAKLQFALIHKRKIKPNSKLS